MEGHSHLAGVNQVTGMSIKVGRRIFSIVEGLGFVNGPSHGFEQLQLVRPAPR